MAGIVWRASVILHRYLGIAVGLPMLSWFLSGIVVMYVGFPQPAGGERLRGLPAIDWGECCRVDAATAPSAAGQAPPLSAAEEIDEDQWTLNRYHQEQPIFRFVP
jgi:hypothetical protein